MGLIKEAKQQALGGEAKRAIEQGRTVFAAMLNTPMTHHTMTGSVAGWAELIESVEAEGWTLAEWAVSVDSKGRPQAYPLFRRAPSGPVRG